MTMLAPPSFDARLGRMVGEYTVSAGATSNALALPRSAGDEKVTIMAKPAPGGTALVQFTLDGYDDMDAGTADWLDWPKGGVTSDDADVLLGPVTGVRFTATTQDCDFRVVYG